MKFSHGRRPGLGLTGKKNLHAEIWPADFPNDPFLEKISFFSPKILMTFF